MHSIRKQSGHAAMLFAMMIPAFFGIFTLASDGARALQSKARLEDAAEAAVLAIAAHNADNSGSSSGSAINKKIASDWIGQYMQDMQTISDIKIKKLNCNDIAECKEGLENGEPRYFQYEIFAKTNHLSWFPGNDSTAGFGESFDVTGAATARKFQSESVDVMFVSDFSYSMNDTWSAGRNKKYVDLINIIEDVTVELEKFNKAREIKPNRVGLTGFSFYTKATKNSSCYQDQYVRWVSTTIAQIFDEKTSSCKSYRGNFYDLPLTDNYAQFNNKLSRFKPVYNSGTASYQGIIRGAQMMDSASEPRPRRIIIILSDGEDSSQDGHDKKAKKLVAAGMCTKILSTLGAGLSYKGELTKTKMAVVGFDYVLESNKTLADCVGSNNVYKANSPEEILNKILELISEEIGHLK